MNNKKRKTKNMGGCYLYSKSIIGACAEICAVIITRIQNYRTRINSSSRSKAHKDKGQTNDQIHKL